MSIMNCDSTGNCMPVDLPVNPLADTSHDLAWYALHVGAPILLGLLAFWILMAFVGPIYSVWEAHKAGQADLAQARNEQAIQVAQAESRLAAAEANKRAAIVEAEAAAEQIRIIGENAAAHPLYLTWQWIKMMETRDGSTIYVPTEANLPVLEAGRSLAGGAK